MLRIALVAVGLGLAGLTTLYFTQPRESAAVNQPKPSAPFAADRLPQTIAFDGEKAMDHLRAICAIGPRISGTEGMRKQQELIQAHFEKLGAKVEYQRFTAKQVSRREPVDMANMIVSFHPDSKRRIILCSHYDTRPIADQEPDPRKWREPFVSANDGGSGVAFLMEFGRHIKDIKTNVGVDFVIFDGEEYIFDSARDKYFFGSEHFAQNWRKDPKGVRYEAAILLDMIAGKNARFPVEGHSWRYRDLCLEIWGIAKQLNCNAFEERIGAYVLDDHIALQKVGIPAINIIDFDYPHWHRLTDTPESCTAEPMEQVATVLHAWLRRR